LVRVRELHCGDLEVKENWKIRGVGGGLERSGRKPCLPVVGVAGGSTSAGRGNKGSIGGIPRLVKWNVTELTGMGGKAT